MPNILVKIPHGSFPGDSRRALVEQINRAAAEAEQMPPDPKVQALCWVLVDETAPGAWTCGGNDLTADLLPCLALVCVPAGVLDAAARQRYAQLMHAAFKAAMPLGDSRRLATSVPFLDVPDRSWGVNGTLWGLADFARVAGFAHLQHLVSTEGVAA